MIQIPTTKAIIGGLLLAGLIFLGTSYVINEQEKDMVASVTITLVEQEKTLSNLAEITDRNGADQVVESIITDCKRRERFDNLLNRLAELTAAELAEVEDLFDGCAGYFAERKAVMVARLEREFEIYSNLVNLLAIVDDSITVSQYQLTDWQQLMTLEKKRSEVFTEQVKVQYDIVKALQEGQAVSSAFMSGKVAEAKNISEEAEVLNHQIDALRTKLLDV